MATTDMLDPAVLRKLIDYDPLTGAMIWKIREPFWFTKGPFAPEHQAKVWNAQFSGKPALACITGNGYREGHVLRRSLKAHRAAWAIMTGEWPDGFIDHINGKRADNRWANLRVVTNSENLRNARMRADNLSGCNGVGWHRASGKWRARITVANKQVHLGTFDTKDAAIAARTEAERGRGFTTRHGRREQSHG